MHFTLSTMQFYIHMHIMWTILLYRCLIRLPIMSIPLLAVYICGRLHKLCLWIPFNGKYMHQLLYPVCRLFWCCDMSNMCIWLCFFCGWVSSVYTSLSGLPKFSDWVYSLYKWYFIRKLMRWIKSKWLSVWFSLFILWSCYFWMFIV